MASISCAAVLVVLGIAISAAAESDELSPIKDNTLYEDEEGAGVAAFRPVLQIEYGGGSTAVTTQVWGRVKSGTTSAAVH